MVPTKSLVLFSLFFLFLKPLVLISVVLAQLPDFRGGEHPGFYNSTLNLKLKEMPQVGNSYSPLGESGISCL